MTRLNLTAVDCTLIIQREGATGQSIQHLIMFQSIPTGYIPPGNPRGLAQKTCPGGWDLIFESCPGAGNSTRAGIMWKMELNLQKNSVDQIFTGENKKKQKKQVEFLTFFEVYVFFQWNFPGLWVNFLVLLSHIPYKKV